MIEFTEINYLSVNQKYILMGDCIVKIFDEEYNLIKTKCIPVQKLSDFILSIAYK